MLLLNTILLIKHEYSDPLLPSAAFIGRSAKILILI